MSSDRASGMDERNALTPVQIAVFSACVHHLAQSFMPITPDVWWRAEPPFRGSRATFACHLRSLTSAGVLARRTTPRANYDLTLRGERLAATIQDQPATPLQL